MGKMKKENIKDHINKTDGYVYLNSEYLWVKKIGVSFQNACKIYLEMKLSKDFILSICSKY